MSDYEKMSFTAFVKQAMKLHENVEFESYVALLPWEIDDDTNLNDFLCVDALYPDRNGRLLKFGSWSDQSGMFWPED